MNDYLKRPMTEEEDKYTFRQSNQISGQTGLIGYLRADFGRDGNEFYSSWEDWNNNLKTPDFKQELDEVINCLREEGDILSGRAAMSRYCNDTPQSKMTKESYFYGVRVDTDKYAYLLRMNLNKGDYNLYCYCYVKEWLDNHMEKARRGIRFIDSNYNEKFRIADGDNTTPKGSQSNDPFWDTAASMLLLALVFYLHYEAPPEEQNFAMVMEMLRAASIEDEEDTRPSPLDELFSELEFQNPEHIALKYYHSYHAGSAKTLKSIQITLAARLEKFNLESLASLTITDELDLPSMGEKKVALFALIPDNDSSFNFLVSILYTQLFQQLFFAADHIHGGSLPMPVHFLMDEFANVSLPDDFDKILSVMRSRGVSVSIILQNLAQLKALFEKQWESIVGNCDEFLYLGGNEQSTHKYVSELLGKETIDTNTFGKSMGRNGNYSTNYQISGRELLTPDEVRLLDNQYAILFIRGERPVMDFKYDILKHPNVAMTADGKEKPYRHGEVNLKTSSIAVLDINPKEVSDIQTSETTYELLSDEDFEDDNNF